MKLIRFIVGRILLLLDFLTRPSPVIRSRKDQDSVDAAVSGLSQYRSSRSDSAAADLAAFASDFVRSDTSIFRLLKRCRRSDGIACEK